MTVGLAGKVIAYDYANRPTSVLFAGIQTDYTYGPDGARQTKTVNTSNPPSETFYAGIAEIRNFGGAGEAVSYLHRDHLASVRLITNAAGQVAQSTSYTAFGDPTTATLLAFSFEARGFIGAWFGGGF